MISSYSYFLIINYSNSNNNTSAHQKSFNSNEYKFQKKEKIFKIIKRHNLSQCKFIFVVLINKI